MARCPILCHRDEIIDSLLFSCKVLATDIKISNKNPLIISSCIGNEASKGAQIYSPPQLNVSNVKANIVIDSRRKSVSRYY